MQGIRVTHNGGVWPAGQALAGQTVGTLTFYDLRRQIGGPDRGEPRGYGFDISLAPTDSPKLYPLISPVLESWHEGDLKKYSDLGVITVEELLEEQWYLLQDQIQYNPDVYTGASGGWISFYVEVTDADGKKLIVTNVTEVTVQITVDSAGGSTLQLPDGTAGTGSGVGATIVVPIVYGEGRSEVQIYNAAPSNVTVGLVDSGGTGLDVTDTAVITIT